MLSGDSDHVYDVIVIGAGFSGLIAARLLAQNDLDVLVLEAKDRVGGRTLTVKNSNVGWVELGGAYVGRTQNHFLRLIKEFDLKIYPVNEVQNIVFYDGFTNQRALFKYDKFPIIDPLTLLDFNHVLRLLDKMGKSIPSDAPWKAPKAREWDTITVKQFFEQNTITKRSRQLLRVIMTNIVFSEPYESSLLWFAWYVKQCHGMKSIMSTTNGGQEFKISGGVNQITQRLVNYVGKERVLLQHAVCYIRQPIETDNFALVRTIDGKQFRCRHVIIATPPPLQQKIHFEPPLSSTRNQLIQRAQMGAGCKCVIYYKNTFWREKDMCGSLVIIGNDYRFPIPITFDDTKNDGSFPAIIGFIPTDKARKVMHLPKQDRIDIICKSLSVAFNCEEALHPIHYEEHNWEGDQYCGGGPTMVCAPGFLTQFGPYLREPFGRIFFAGTECATEWSGYINGAIQAGERAARQVLVEVGKLSRDQVNQAEPDSLDYPPIPYERDLFEQYAPSAKNFLYGIILLSAASFALMSAYNSHVTFRFRFGLPFA